MAEAIGLIASVIQVAGAGLKLSQTLYQYADGVATADRRIKDIAKEIQLTSFVIEELGDVFKHDETSTLMSKNAVKTANETMKECSSVFAEIDATLKKSKKNTLGRLMLPFRDNKIELLRNHIDKLKSTLQLLMQVLTHAHQIATKKLDREAEAKQKAQIQELIELKKQSTKKYEESLRNISLSDGSTILDPDEAASDKDDLDDGSVRDLTMAAAAIGSTITSKTLATCVQHVRSLLEDIETLQQALTTKVEGDDHSEHHQSLIGSYFRARGHLDGILFSGSPAQNTGPNTVQEGVPTTSVRSIDVQVDMQRVTTGSTLNDGLSKQVTLTEGGSVDLPREKQQETQASEAPDLEAELDDLYARRKALRQEAHQKEDAKEVRRSPIRFKDTLGRLYSLPFHTCKTWEGMQKRIARVYDSDDYWAHRVHKGRFDIVDNDGYTILNEDWEDTIEPGMSLTMRFWDSYPRASILKDAINEGIGELHGREGYNQIISGRPQEMGDSNAEPQSTYQGRDDCADLEFAKPHEEGERESRVELGRARSRSRARAGSRMSAREKQMAEALQRAQEEARRQQEEVAMRTDAERNPPAPPRNMSRPASLDIPVTQPTPGSTPLIPRPSAEKARIIRDQTEEQEQLDSDIEMKDVPLSIDNSYDRGEDVNVEVDRPKVDLPPPPPLEQDFFDFSQLPSPTTKQKVSTNTDNILQTPAEPDQEHERFKQQTGLSLGSAAGEIDHDPYKVPAKPNRGDQTRTEALQAEIDATVAIMHENINRVSERGERFDSLQEKTNDLAASAVAFRRAANKQQSSWTWGNPLAWLTTPFTSPTPIAEAEQTWKPLNPAMANQPKDTRSDSASKATQFVVEQPLEDLIQGSFDREDDVKRPVSLTSTSDSAPAKPSHEYERFKQQTGLPSGSIADLSYPPRSGLSFSSTGLDEMSMMSDFMSLTPGELQRQSDVAAGSSGNSSRLEVNRKGDKDVSPSDKNMKEHLPPVTTSNADSEHPSSDAKDMGRVAEREEMRRRLRKNQREEEHIHAAEATATLRWEKRSPPAISNSSSKRPASSRRGSGRITTAQAEEQRRFLTAEIAYMKGESQAADARDRKERAANPQHQQEVLYYDPSARFSARSKSRLQEDTRSSSPSEGAGQRRRPSARRPPLSHGLREQTSPHAPFLPAGTSHSGPDPTRLKDDNPALGYVVSRGFERRPGFNTQRTSRRKVKVATTGFDAQKEARMQSRRKHSSIGTGKPLSKADVFEQRVADVAEESSSSSTSNYGSEVLPSRRHAVRRAFVRDSADIQRRNGLAVEPYTVRPPTAVLPGQPLTAQPHPPLAAYGGSMSPRSRATGVISAPTSAPRVGPQSQLPRLSTNDMKSQHSPTASYNTQAQSQPQSTQQEQPSPTIYFQHWVPPSSAGQEKAADGNSPATPSGEYKATDTERSRTLGGNSDGDIEISAIGAKVEDYMSGSGDDSEVYSGVSSPHGSPYLSKPPELDELDAGSAVSNNKTPEPATYNLGYGKSKVYQKMGRKDVEMDAETASVIRTPADIIKAKRERLEELKKRRRLADEQLGRKPDGEGRQSNKVEDYTQGSKRMREELDLSERLYGSLVSFGVPSTPSAPAPPREQSYTPDVNVHGGIRTPQMIMEDRRKRQEAELRERSDEDVRPGKSFMRYQSSFRHRHPVESLLLPSSIPGGGPESYRVPATKAESDPLEQEMMDGLARHASSSNDAKRNDRGDVDEVEALLKDWTTVF